MVEVEFGEFNLGPHGDPDDQDAHGAVRAAGQARSERLPVQHRRGRPAADHGGRFGKPNGCLPA